MYTEQQLDAIRRAQEILREAGLRPNDIFTEDLASNENSLLSSSLLSYTPLKATMLTQNELDEGKGRINRVGRSGIHGVVDHPIGAILEFPETGAHMNMAIAHRYAIDIDHFIHPKDNIQYSFGRDRWMRRDVQCLQLRDQTTGEPVLCKKTKLNCGSIKTCSFNPSGLQQKPSTVSLDAFGEVLMKTLGFFCALKENGCNFSKKGRSSSDDASESDGTLDEPTTGSLVAILKDSRSPRRDASSCAGKISLKKNKYGYFVCCEFFKRSQRNHLRLRNLNEYNIDYLEALMNDELAHILTYENAAANQGYGPLVSCDITAATSEQKELCPMWHRDTKGILQRGTMILANDCPCQFEIFEPNDLRNCPYVLIISRNPHSHNTPHRMKTPETIRRIFNSLLEPLQWRLADATARRLLLDNTFMHGLREVLGWIDIRDPGFGDLHPSLANYDHTARLIDELRYERYPMGTGLEGARHLFQQQLSSTPDEQYVRSIETHEDLKEGKFHIVVCMFRRMSSLLLETKRPSIDTSFKRLHKWQEFEIEAWYPEYSRSIVVARAFTTSQSALAHQVLFRTIFGIVETDTGKAVHFRHIHGDGFESITADGHRGQALGLALYCQEICVNLTDQFSHEWRKPLSTLTPTEHLACFYRYCFAHYTRNVASLRSHVKENVFSAMMSLASSDPLANYRDVLNTIRMGGKKAADWLKDKEAHGSYMLAAIYRPLSKMTIETWKAAPSTSNGNEQAHRNINRDGTKLTMLAGIMRGFQFDSRTLRNIEVWREECIPPRDRLATHFRRSARAIQKKTNSQQRLVMEKDAEIQILYEKAQGLRGTIRSTAASVKRALDSRQDPSREQKRLRICEEQLHETQRHLERLVPQGSGSISLDEVQTLLPSSLYSPGLLNSEVKHEEITDFKPSVGFLTQVAYPQGYVPSTMHAYDLYAPIAGASSSSQPVQASTTHAGSLNFQHGQLYSTGYPINNSYPIYSQPLFSNRYSYPYSYYPPF